MVDWGFLKPVFAILDELAIDDGEVEEEEKGRGGQGQVAPAEETFWQVETPCKRS